MEGCILTGGKRKGCEGGQKKISSGEKNEQIGWEFEIIMAGTEGRLYWINPFLSGKNTCGR